MEVALYRVPAHTCTDVATPATYVLDVQRKDTIAAAAQTSPARCRGTSLFCLVAVNARVLRVCQAAHSTAHSPALHLMEFGGLAKQTAA